MPSEINLYCLNNDKASKQGIVRHRSSEWGGRILRHKDMSSLSNRGLKVLILGSRSHVHPLIGKTMTQLYILYLIFYLALFLVRLK